MYCGDVLERLSGFSSGELPPDLRRAVQTHLKGCAACRSALGRVDVLAGVLADVQAPPVPSRLAARIMTAARGRQAEPVTAWNLLRWWWVASSSMRAAAAAVLVVGLALGLAMGWTTLSVPQTAPTQDVAQGDPLDDYNVDYLGDAPAGSLADSYLALVSDRNGEGR
jgi:anti-sigma factor RsiW